MHAIGIARVSRHITAMALLLGMGGAQAAVVVAPGDVSGGQYTYEIGYNNYSQGYADAETNINFTYRTWSDGSRWHYARNGQSFAQLVLHWDFSGSGLTPKSVSLMDRTTLFTNTATDRTEAVVDYSTDGSTWHTIDVQTTPDYPNATSSVVNDDWTSVVLGLGGGADDFYYRLTMRSLTDGCSSGNSARCDANGAFSNYQNQWSRVNPGVTSFSAAFSDQAVVPLPAAGWLFGAGLLGLLGGARRRRRH